MFTPGNVHGSRELSQEEVAQLRSAAPEFVTAEGTLPPGVWPGASCQITGSPLEEVSIHPSHQKFLRIRNDTCANMLRVSCKASEEGWLLHYAAPRFEQMDFQCYQLLCSSVVCCSAQSLHVDHRKMPRR